MVFSSFTATGRKNVKEENPPDQHIRQVHGWNFGFLNHGDVYTAPGLLIDRRQIGFTYLKGRKGL